MSKLVDFARDIELSPRSKKEYYEFLDTLTLEEQRGIKKLLVFVWTCESKVI